MHENESRIESRNSISQKWRRTLFLVARVSRVLFWRLAKTTFWENGWWYHWRD